MRAFEITILLICILMAPTVVQAMGVVPNNAISCTTIDCQARDWILQAKNSFSLKEIDLTASPGQIAWDAVTFAVTFPIYATFWMLYFLSMIIFVGPAMQSMFHVPAVLSTYLDIGFWILWLAAYVQWKRGGLGLDASR